MLKTLTIHNFTKFPDATLEFSSGLNVIVGENGTGKTHILKLGYAALYVASQVPEKADEKEKEVVLRNALKGIFKASSVNKLFSFTGNGQRTCSVDTLLDQATVAWIFNFDEQIISAPSDAWMGKNKDQGSLDFFTAVNIAVKKRPRYPVFIPAKEMLSIYPGFTYALENRELAFDDTYLHLAKALGAAELKGEALKAIESYAQNVERITNTICIKYNDKFLLEPFKVEQGEVSQYPKIEAHLAAEGDRKIGMLSYLLHNGTLQPGASLFWDEPEANLNPKLIKKLAAVLVELSGIMQITIATHSLFLLRELEILQENRGLVNARYFGLHLTDNGVEVMAGDSSDDIGDIAALDASVAQSEDYMNLQYEK